MDLTTYPNQNDPAIDVRMLKILSDWTSSNPSLFLSKQTSMKRSNWRSRSFHLTTEAKGLNGRFDRIDLECFAEQNLISLTVQLSKQPITNAYVNSMEGIRNVNSEWGGYFPIE